MSSRTFVSPAVALVAVTALATGCMAELEDSTAAEPVASSEQPLFGGVDDQGNPCWLLPTCWFPHRELVENDDLYTGGPAWADDDHDVAVAESAYLRRLSIPPLQGWWDTRDHRFRVLITQPGSSQRLALGAELRGQVEELTWMRSAGYALVKRWDAATQTLEWLRIDAVDGSAARVVAVTGENLGLAEVTVVPSPDGQRLAHVSCTISSFITTPDGVNVVVPVSPMPCTVRQLDAETLAEVAPTATVVLPEMPHGGPGKKNQYDYPGTTSWRPDGTLVVGNRVATTFAIAPDGSVSTIGLPTCRGPLTTSSQVSGSGVRVGVSGKKVVVRAAEPNGNDAFGCP